MKTWQPLLLCVWMALGLPVVTMAQQPVIIIPPSGGYAPAPGFDQGAASDQLELQRRQHQFELERQRRQQEFERGPQYQWETLGRRRVTIGSVSQWCVVRWDARTAATLLTECSEKEAQ
jgi:hypothetical protein